MKKAILVTCTVTTRKIIDIPEGKTLEQTIQDGDWPGLFDSVSKSARETILQNPEGYLCAENMEFKEDTEVPAKPDEKPDLTVPSKMNKEQNKTSAAKLPANVDPMVILTVIRDVHPEKIQKAKGTPLSICKTNDATFLDILVGSDGKHLVLYEWADNHRTEIIEMNDILKEEIGAIVQRINGG